MSWNKFKNLTPSEQFAIVLYLMVLFTVVCLVVGVGMLLWR